MKIVWYDAEGVARRLMNLQEEVVSIIAAHASMNGLIPYRCDNTLYAGTSHPENFPHLSIFDGAQIPTTPE